MKEQITIKVNFKYAKFNGKDGYCIYHYTDERGESIVCIGTYLPQNKTLSYEFSGYWKETEKYGKNFMVQSFKEVVEMTKTGIVSYLTSMLAGVGKVIAERIYDKYGNEALSVIEHNPDSLLSIRGISPKKLKRITDSYKEKFVLRELTEYLLPFGFTVKQIVTLYNKEEIQNIEQLRADPYVLCRIPKTSISSVDAVARSFSYPPDGRERLIAHVMHVLTVNESNGNTGMEANAFGVSLLNSLASSCYTKNNICAFTIELIKQGVICHRKITVDGKLLTFIFRPSIYKAESQIADKLIKLRDAKKVIHSDINKYMDDFSKKRNFVFDSRQKQAIMAAVNGNVTVITGGPGTGKTTIIQAIAGYLKKHENRNLYFMAPSGRAARRIEESTGYQATTIHKGLNIRPGEEFKMDELTHFENATIFVDEFSMVDVFLCRLLLSCIEVGCRLIMVGDVNQLPSVGPGAILRDIIESETVPVMRLENVHRQSENSMIYINSQKVVKGCHDILPGSDFKIIQSASPEEAQKKMIDSYISHARESGIENIYCLCPCKKRAAGVEAMNEQLQASMNPPAEGKKEFRVMGVPYRIGDPVMHLKNSMEVSNGDIGYVTRIYDDDGTPTLVVTYFGDTEVEYTSDDSDDFTLAYAYTVHKAQGSENDTIITFLSNTMGKRMLKRNLVNTAITRGSKMVELYLTGDTALDDAIDNDDSHARITSLKYHLQYTGGKFVAVS